MKALILGWVWPEPASSAAGSRILSLIEVLQYIGYQIHFASAANKTDYSFQFSNEVIEHKVNLNDSSFDDWLKELDPKLVLFDRINCEEYFGWRVNKYCPDAIRVLDCEDLQCLRIAREKALKKNIEFHYEDLINEPVSLREIACIRRSDLSIIISKVEIQILQDIFKVHPSKIHYTPLLIETPKNFKNFEERSNFMSIGNFKHPPNLDAVKYLKSNIWPIIRKLKPDAEIDIYGSYCTDKVLQFNDIKNGFHIHGRANNAIEVISNAKVLLAPIRYGAGQKGKLLEAMYSGTPSITSSIGAESMLTDHHWGGFVSNDDQSFAKNAIKLLDSKTEWEIAKQNGLAILKKHFDKIEHQSQLKHRLSTLNVIESRANQDFNDKLTIHHSFKNAEFMSKWIEIKQG